MKTIPEIEWNSLAVDDFASKWANYTLRVEQMDSGSWWWAVYREDEEIEMDTVSTELEAKLSAELCFLKSCIPVIIKGIQYEDKKWQQDYDSLLVKYELLLEKETT